MTTSLARRHRGLVLAAILTLVPASVLATDLSIRKQALNQEVSVGDQFAYTIVVDNTSNTGGGPYDSPNTTMVDQLPAGLQFVSVTTTQGGCEASGQNVYCELGTISAGSSVTITLTVQALVSGTITNTATSEGDLFDPDEGNNSSSSTVVVIAAQPDLVLTKEASVQEIAPGQTVVYTLTVTNNGTATANDVSVVDDFPLNLEFESATTTKGSCDTIRPTCNVGTLNPGESATVTFTGLFKPISTQGPGLHNSATTSTSDDDATPSDNAASVTISVLPFTDLSVTKEALSEAAVGDTVTYTITVDNFSLNDAEATEVNVSDVLPDGTEYVGHTTSQGSCFYAPAAHALECDLGTMQDNSTATITVTVVIRSTTEAQISNHVGVRSIIEESHPDDNESIVTTSIAPHADLSIAKTTETESLVPGDLISYTITVTNNGNAPAEGVAIADPLVLNLTGESITTTKGTCDNITFDCQVGTLAAGETATITITALFRPISTQPPFVRNVATVTTTGSDVNDENNSSQLFTTVEPFTDLAVTKEGPTESVAVGDTIVYTITVDNHSLNDVNATGVSASDVLPSGVEYVSHTSSKGTCFYAPGAHALECDLGDMVDPSTATITVTVVVTAPGAIVNVVGASSDLHENHPDDNTAEHTIGAEAGPSRDDAASTSVGMIDDVCPNPDEAAVSVSLEPIPAGSTVSSHDAEEYSVTLDTAAWVSYVDCYPSAKYAHLGAVITYELEPEDDGSEIQLEEINWWVEIDGEPMISSDPYDDEQLVHGEEPEPEPLNGSAITNEIPPPSAPRVCALLVSGEGRDAEEQRAFDLDVDIMADNLSLESMGPQIPTENVRKLKNPTEAELLAAIDALKDQCDTIYFYYSGHSDEFAMSLRNDTDGFWVTLGPRLYSTNASTINVILDSCESGAAIPKMQEGSSASLVDQEMTIITASSADKSSYTFTVLTDEQTGGARIRLGFFSWHFNLCLGEPQADADGDGETSMTETFDWVIAVNPSLSGMPITQKLMPQISTTSTASADVPDVTPPRTDVSIRSSSSQPFDSGARLSVSTQRGLMDTSTNDTRVEEIATGRFWEITLSNQVNPFSADLTFALDPSVDVLTSDAVPGLVWREDLETPWEAYLPTVYDPSAMTVTAHDVNHFSQWAIAAVDGASAVNADGLMELPAEFALYGNYPNPFNPTTTIAFDVAQGTHVTLNVYDALGRRVATLADRPYAAGRHEAVFAAESLPSGAYIYTISMGGFESRKMMLLVK